MRLSFIILTFFLLAVAVSAGNWTRDNASMATPIETMDPAAFNAFMTAMAPANSTTNVTSITEIVPDIPAALRIALDVYLDPLGNIALVIIFSLPFLMAWIMDANITLPSVMGIIVGGFVLWRLPSTYSMVAIGFIALSVIAVIYSLLKEPH